MKVFSLAVALVALIGAWPLRAQSGPLRLPRKSGSGKESYPSTRYLTVEGKLAGEVVLDFSLAQNPPCAFNLLYSCPFPRRNKWRRGWDSHGTAASLPLASR